MLQQQKTRGFCYCNWQTIFSSRFYQIWFQKILDMKIDWSGKGLNEVDLSMEKIL